jgi:nuclease EXOG
MLRRSLQIAFLAAAFAFGAIVAAALSEQTTGNDLAKYAPDSNYLVRHGFLIGAPDRTGCPRWVLERLDKASLSGPGDRSKSSWHADPDALPERHARDSDYLGSGYSKGHMRPAADAPKSQAQMDDTHSLANASPQAQDFNAQSWERLEEYPRKLARDGAVVWVVTMPIWKPQVSHLKGTGPGETYTHELIVKAIGIDEIWVPTHLAKSLLIDTPDGKRRIESFLAPNTDEAAKDDFNSWRLATDDLEAVAVIDVWHGVHGEKELEKESHRE